MKISLNGVAGVIMGLGLFALPDLSRGAEHTLSEFQLGENISGTEVKLDKLEGKVVVIEYWGTR